MGSEVPRVQCDMAQTGEAVDSPDEREQPEGESPQSDDGKPEQISESDNQCSDTSAVWMDKLLQADGSQRSAGGAGWLDQTETALLVVAAVEETANPGKEPAKSRTE